jgi:hypothetical protein
MDERSAVINIGGKEYELLLTTKATKEIAKRYGGLTQLGENLMKGDSYEDAIEQIVWLITTLANQPTLIYNYQHKGEEKPLLSEDEVELLTTPYDLSDYKEAITEALYKGTKRNVESEEDPKKVADE